MTGGMGHDEMAPLISMYILDTCIGYNSLYTVSGLTLHNGPGLPDGKRLWSWLLLCDDG